MMPTNWLPLETSEGAELSLTSTEQNVDLSSYVGKGLKVVIGCDTAVKISGGATSAITTAKFVYPAGVYEFEITKERCFFDIKSIAATGNGSWYVEKGH